ncbi:lymphatic vessel endothelial hyaluronic acid receptor 1-like [Carcharodon carcharias]|uniref:lymphatic vessel endothelial hyaluronic acid receptor 1-like n=1 Tax=Carcharodon carcharias TaxID=13397 RepID=UPI001B7DF42F|nr:lymphatic vessel endothelial hyaluronic acid receptor 1-like [Carcharodon carcharias]
MEWGILTLIALSQTFLIMTQTLTDVEDIDISKCRIMGIFHIRLKDGYRLSQAQARNACTRFGTELATKSQVEQAQQQGFETCRYGWVDDGFLVIPRISSKEQCGKNGTGVLTWKADPDKQHDGYCFRKNDAQKTNTCEPLIMQTTTVIMNPTKILLMHLGSTDMKTVTESNSEPTPLPDTKTTRVPRETNSFLSAWINTTALSSTSSELLSTLTTAEDHKLSSDWIIWVLGMVVIGLFVVLVAVGVCYLRKRKKNFSYLTGYPKEAIEAEVWTNNLTENSSP